MHGTLRNNYILGAHGFVWNNRWKEVRMKILLIQWLNYKTEKWLWNKTLLELLFITHKLVFINHFLIKLLFSLHNPITIFFFFQKYIFCESTEVFKNVFSKILLDFWKCRFGSHLWFLKIHFRKLVLNDLWKYILEKSYWLSKR